MNSKAYLRKTYLKKRESIAALDHAAWSFLCSERIAGIISSLTTPCKTVALYHPIKAELDVLFLAQILSHTYKLALPAIIQGQKELGFHPWNVTDALIHNAHGIYAPQSTEYVTPDILVVPLLAFDRSGHRLGYGGGYYDVTLQKLREKNPELLTIGAAFALQETQQIPSELFDQKLSRIVTEKEVIVST